MNCIRDSVLLIERESKIDENKMIVCKYRDIKDENITRENDKVIN